MIQQPELGRKIAASRKERGLTQEELVGKCNLNVRTLQRIEAGEVTPRYYTIRLIFDALELGYDQSLKGAKKIGGTAKRSWVRPFSGKFAELNNLKTHNMKKIGILCIAAIALVVGIAFLSGSLFAQSDARVKKIIEKNNSDFMKWFNNGEINALADLYREDACLVSRGCGREFIRQYYLAEATRYKFAEIRIESVSVSDETAVEKGSWRAVLNSGETFGGEYLSEWKLTDNKWLILNESSGLSF